MSARRTAALAMVLAGLLLGPAPAAGSAAAASPPSSGAVACGTGGGFDLAGGSANLSFETFVAPNGSYDRLANPAALRAARANWTLTPASAGVDLTWEDEAVAYRDVVVHRVRLGGGAAALADRLAPADGSQPTARFRSLLADGTVRFGYRGPSACPPELALNASLDRGAIRVVPDPANDAVAFVMDTDRLLFHPLDGGWPTTDARVYGSHGLALTLPAGGGLVDATATAGNAYRVDRAGVRLASRHEGLAQVDRGDGQVVRGETTLAPGSEITVTLVPYLGADERRTATATVNGSRRFAARFDLSAVPDGAIYGFGVASITREPVVEGGAPFVAVGNATGAIVSARDQNSTGRILYGPSLTTTLGGFVTVRNASGGLVGVSEYRDPGTAVAQIHLGPPLDADQRVTVTVYRDVNDNRVYDDADVPYRVNGSPVRDAALVRLERDEQPTNPRTPATTAPGAPSPASPSSGTTPPSTATTIPRQPGFGFDLAVLGALLTLGLVARRRR